MAGLLCVFADPSLCSQPLLMNPSSSPISRLYRHALESIFAVLTLRDLHSVLQVNKEWCSTVDRMPSIGASVMLPRPVACCRSSLTQHVSHCTGCGSAPVSYFTEIAERMPRLSSLSGGIASSEWDHPFTLPPRLQSLSFMLPALRQGQTGLWHLLDAIEPLSLLHTLQIKLTIVQGRCASMHSGFFPR